ncbi:MAG: ABC transporter substrate-binding protein [Salinibacterium sp.]|nr:ABC transporter substrate-binding protein [Salinibacterium sp.]MBF0672541.1 ABC transporter substrate-binding protein [Salinibacterium sp.]
MLSSHNKTRRAATAFASLAAITAFALTGCTTPESDTSGDSVDKRYEISVVLAPLAYETAYQAEEQGYFDELGLDVTLIPGGDPAANLAQLVSGEVDIAMVAASTAITAATNGMPIKVILNNESIDPTASTSGLVAQKGSDITSMADMAGKTVAVLGLSTGAEIQLFEAAEDAGVAFDDVELVVTPLPGMIEALAQGHVDTALIFPPFYSIAQAQGFPVVAEPTKEYGGGTPNTMWVTTEAKLSSDADMIDRFREAMTKAYDFYNDNFEDARRITGEQSELSPEMLADRVYVKREPQVNVERLQNLLELMERFGQVEDAPSAKDLLDSETPTK